MIDNHFHRGESPAAASNDHEKTYLAPVSHAGRSRRPRARRGRGFRQATGAAPRIQLRGVPSRRLCARRLSPGHAGRGAQAGRQRRGPRAGQRGQEQLLHAHGVAGGARRVDAAQGQERPAAQGADRSHPRLDQSGREVARRPGAGAQEDRSGHGREREGNRLHDSQADRGAAQGEDREGHEDFHEHDPRHGRVVCAGADPGGRVSDGQPGHRERPPCERRPAAPSEDFPLLDGPVRGDVERVRAVHVSGRGAQVPHDAQDRRAGGPRFRRRRAPDQALRRDEFRHGQGRLSRDQHDAARGQQVLRVAQREDGALLPPPHRGGMGIRRARRDEDRLFLGRRPGAGEKLCVVREQQRLQVSESRPQAAQSLGPL